MQYNNQFLSPIITSQLYVFSHYHLKYIHRNLNLTNTIGIIRIYLDVYKDSSTGRAILEVNIWNHLALPVYFHQESIIVYIYSFQTLRLCTFLYLLTVFENNNIYFNLGIRQFYYYYITCYTDNSIQVHEV